MKYLVAFTQEIEAFSVEQAAEIAAKQMVELGRTHDLMLEVMEEFEEDLEAVVQVSVENGRAEVVQIQ